MDLLQLANILLFEEIKYTSYIHRIDVLKYLFLLAAARLVNY